MLFGNGLIGQGRLESFRAYTLPCALTHFKLTLDPYQPCGMIETSVEGAITLGERRAIRGLLVSGGKPSRLFLSTLNVLSLAFRCFELGPNLIPSLDP